MSKYVIIDSEAIQKRIEDLEKELQSHEAWYEKARENYNRDRKIWGQAHDGEMRLASHAASEVRNEIKTLKQTLSSSTPLIPEIEKAFDAGYDLNTWEQLEIPNEERDYLNEQDYIKNLKLDI